MVMVDKLLYHDDHKTISGLHLDNGNIFISNGKFLEAGLIENIAQTAALRNGWMALQQAGEGVETNIPVGMIGGIKNFRLFAFPKVNSEIKTEVTVQTEIMNALIITGKVKEGEKLMAECEMKIFIQGRAGN